MEEERTPAEVRVDRPVRPACSQCGFPLDEYNAGLRHFGTHTAHVEWYCTQRMRAQIAQLTAALKKANEQAEHFEREWYLRVDEIERLQGEALRFDRELRKACPHGSQCMARGSCWRKCSLKA